MRLVRCVLLSLVAILCLSGCFGRPAVSVASDPVGASEEYKLGAGDVISIRVFGGDEDLRFDKVRLNDRGALTFPFGDFTAFGRTTRELESDITGTLKGQFLLKPRVWVNIEEYRPFYMQGEIGRPGAYPYQPGLTVRRAITIAGGFRERAAKEKIFVVREQDKTNTPVRVDLNTPVRPGDTITVEESFF